MTIDTLQKSNVKLWVSKSTGKEKFYKVGREFVIELLSGMAKLAVKYYESDFIDFPYLYGEMQLASLILPTLSRMSKGAVMSEVPIQRDRHLKNVELNNTSGRLDYWCVYEKFSFCIEVKHSFDAFRNKITRQEDIDDWEYMNTVQLKSLDKELKKWKDGTKGRIRIGLHFITSYTQKELTEKQTIIALKQYKEDIPSMLERLYSDFSRGKKSTTPDVMACWMPPQEIVLANDTKSSFPGFIVMAKLFQPIY